MDYLQSTAGTEESIGSEFLLSGSVTGLYTRISVDELYVGYIDVEDIQSEPIDDRESFKFKVLKRMKATNCEIVEPQISIFFPCGSPNHYYFYRGSPPILKLSSRN